MQSYTTDVDHIDGRSRIGSKDKGRTIQVRVHGQEQAAKAVVSYYRLTRSLQTLYTVRVFKRDIRADGLRISLWVSVVRERVTS